MARLLFSVQDRDGNLVEFETSEHEGKELMATYPQYVKWLLDYLGKQPPKGRSTLALWTCDCEPPQRARVGKDIFLAECPVCRSSFKRRS